jgi:predicted amidophosphoribosyltransferase
MLRGGIRVVSAFEHTGPAAQMAHALKYRGNDLLIRLAAKQLTKIVATGRVFVPIPRVWTRYVRYSVDPSQELARQMAQGTDGVVLEAISRPFHNRRRAGAKQRGAPPTFAMRQSVGGRVILVDDVLTSGATILAAVEIIGFDKVDFVVTATAARQVSSPSPHLPI